VAGPWIGANLVRFEHPVTLSTNDGRTLLGANCPEAYYGETAGLWILSCVVEHAKPDVADESVSSAAYRREALHFVRTHMGDQPRVVAVRVLRTWSMWSPRQEVFLNSGEGDETWVSWSSIVGSWAMMALGAVGFVLLRRRDRPVWPLGVNLVATTVISALFYGLARFRIGADVALLVAAAVTLVALFDRSRRASDPAIPQ